MFSKGCLLLILLTFYSLDGVAAHEIEGFAGAQYTSFDDFSDYNNYGISAQLKYNWYSTSSNSGYFAAAYLDGVSILVGDFILGYGWRWGRDYFFETGPVLAYHAIFGPGYGGLISFGFRIGTSTFFSFPCVLRLPGYFRGGPMIGFSF